MKSANEIDSHRSLAPIGCKQLAVYLLESGLLTEAQMMVATYDKKATGMSLSEIVVARGWIQQEMLDDLYEKVIIPERMNLQKGVTYYQLDRGYHRMSLPDWLKSKGLLRETNKEELTVAGRSNDLVEWTID